MRDWRCRPGLVASASKARNGPLAARLLRSVRWRGARQSGDPSRCTSDRGEVSFRLPSRPNVSARVGLPVGAHLAARLQPHPACNCTHLRSALSALRQPGGAPTCTNLRQSGLRFARKSLRQHRRDRQAREGITPTPKCEADLPRALGKDPTRWGPMLLSLCAQLRNPTAHVRGLGHRRDGPRENRSWCMRSRIRSGRRPLTRRPRHCVVRGHGSQRPSRGRPAQARNTAMGSPASVYPVCV